MVVHRPRSPLPKYPTFPKLQAKEGRTGCDISLEEKDWQIGTQTVQMQLRLCTRSHRLPGALASLPPSLGPSLWLLAFLSSCFSASWMIKDLHLDWGPSDQ